MAFLHPPDAAGVAYEFFAPFAHLPGRYEWCRVRSPTHGVVDLFIVLGASTSVPADVYVRDAAGARFMRERYPECATHRAKALTIHETRGGRTVRGAMRSPSGPVRSATMTFRASATARPEQAPYGGAGRPVWGGRFTCWGIDLNLEATVDGSLVHAEGRRQALRGAKGIVTLGSFGRLAPLP